MSGEPRTDPRRRTFGPVVLLGLAGGTLAAVAGAKPWAEVEEGSSAFALAAVSDSAGEMPVAAALSLVALATWGVVLVTRGRFRRAVVVLGVLAAAGALVAAVVGWWQTAEPLEEALRQVGVEGSVGHTAWYWAALVGSGLALVAGLLAVRLVPAWPEMGSRYDAPTAGPDAAATQASDVPAQERSNLDLWKALDEGEDPTA